jgi:solute carrier family 13 (sodium-dependent dicarboxylate transporter), member 2/3/5
MNGRLSFFLRVAVGPLAFLAVQAVPLAGLKPGAHFALASYAWVVAWWATAPIPWAVTGFLPLVLFPLGGAMPFADVIALYGQRVFPFLMGVMLFGHAFQKHGLARRMAMGALSIPGVATSGNRLVLMMMVVSAVVSAFVDDAATVAIMVPIALSVARFSCDADNKAPRMLETSALAVLYGASAGGMATPAGVPFNPLAISLLDQLTGYKISFGQWTLTGVILMAATLPVYYMVLKVMSPPEVKSISGGAAYFREQSSKLGRLGRGEKNVLFVLIVMIVLWFLPGFVTIRTLDIWYVPPVAMVLLFLLPVNARTGEMTLNSKDFQDGVLWNVLFLVVSGTALAAGLVKLGITDWLQNMLTGGVSAAALPWFAGFVTPILSHLTSGTATTSMVSTVLFPIAKDVGYNPAILARIIAGTALAVSFPWAGAAAGSAFGSGSITFGRMFRIGAVVTVLTVVVITGLSIIIVPALNAFTAP